MYDRLSILAGLAIALGLGAPGAAQEARKYDRVDTATVSRIDVQARRISVDAREGPRTFVVEPVTRILREGEPIELGAVRVGDRVVVEARDEVSDPGARLVADRILVVVGEEPPPEAGRASGE